MKKYMVGYTYTVWVNVEAESADEAIQQANEVNFSVTTDVLNTTIDNDYNDPICYLVE